MSEDTIKYECGGANLNGSASIVPPSTHVTDQYIHWSDHDAQKLKDVMRPAYDKIVAAGFEAELMLLISQARSSAYDDGCDSCNPDL